MRGSIYLSGGGSSKLYATFDEKVIANLSVKNILIIPFANRHKSNQEMRNWGNKVFNKKNEISVSVLSDIGALDEIKIQKYGLIYISGGNTFRLKKEFSKSNNLRKILIKYVSKGGIIYASSAGAAILGKTINTASFDDQNYDNIKNFEGINILKNNSVYCHYTKDKIKIIETLNNKYNIGKIILIEEGSVVKLKGAELSLVKGKSYLFENLKLRNFN